MYIIMEVQVFVNGQMSTPCYAFDDKNKAEAKYHDILSKAAVSALPRHTCFMLTADGYAIKSESFTHEAEPEQEATE